MIETGQQKQVKPKKSRRTREAKNASVIFGRQELQEALANEKKYKKKKEGSCFDACFQGLLGYPSDGGKSGGNASSDGGYSQKPLQELAGATSYSNLSERQQQGLTVIVDSRSKDAPGWINQDAVMACCPVAPGSSLDSATPPLLFGVFDGHGRKGHEASEVASERLGCHLVSMGEQVASHPDKAMTKSVMKADEDIFNSLGPDVEYSGTTAVAALVDLAKRRLHCANVGDSRAILGRVVGGTRWEAVPLTSDVKPSISEERERIELCGGVVSAHMEDGEPCGPVRVWDSAALVKPGLAVSRSLGDGCARCIGVIPDPVMTTHHLTAEDRFILLASDGVWDAVSNEKVVQIISMFLKKEVPQPDLAVKALLNAVRREQEDEFVDDTTVVMVVFPKL